MQVYNTLRYPEQGIFKRKKEYINDNNDKYDIKKKRRKKKEERNVFLYEILQFCYSEVQKLKDMFCFNYLGLSVMAHYYSKVIPGWNCAFERLRRSGEFKELCETAQKTHGKDICLLTCKGPFKCQTCNKKSLKQYVPVSVF